MTHIEHVALVDKGLKTHTHTHKTKKCFPWNSAVQQQQYTLGNSLQYFPTLLSVPPYAVIHGRGHLGATVSLSNPECILVKTYL